MVTLAGQSDVDLDAPDTVRDPFSLYHHLRNAEALPQSRGGAWIVSRHADVRRVLTEACTFAAAPSRLPNRQLFAPALGNTAVERFGPSIDRKIGGALDRVPSGHPVDIVPELVSPLIEAILPAALDLPHDGHRQEAASSFVRVAGIETTTSLVSGAIAILARHPHQWRALRQAPELVPNAVEECLRYDGPTHMLIRTVLQPVAVHGRSLERGDVVVALPASANRDAAAFVEPDTFRLDRPAGPHLAFGAGAHYCLGANLTRLICATVLRQMACRFESLTCDEESARYQPGLSVRALRSLIVEFR